MESLGNGGEVTWVSRGRDGCGGERRGVAYGRRRKGRVSGLLDVLPGPMAELASDNDTAVFYASK